MSTVRGAPEKMEEGVGGAYFDDIFEEQRSNVPNT